MRATGRELLDDPVGSLDELEENFTDIEAANRVLGGIRAARDAVFAFSPRTVLDVGTGSSDIPRALVYSARQRGDTLSITCLDSSADVLEIAKRKSASDGALTFVRADGEKIPFGNGSFDVAMCNLTLHHCDPPHAVALLRELRRVARKGVVVTDLRRSRIAWLGAWMLARVFSRNRLTRHDAPLSVLRAYTLKEALDFALRAGWKNPRVRRAAFFRMVMTDA